MKVTFDFDGLGGIANTAATNTTSLGVSGSVTDAINDTGGSVRFSVSYFASFPSMTGAPTSVTLNISDGTGTGLAFSNFAQIPGSTISPSSSNVIFSLTTPTTNGATQFTGTATAKTSAGTINGQVFGNFVTFTLGASNFVRFDSLTVTFTCFCAGTRIATPDGFCQVEELQPGDMIQTAEGRDVSIRWIGRQPVDMERANPREANPIRITRGALGDGLPKRDLRVSPDHAICIDGLLINAGALVNGTTIYQEQNVTEDFTYYHIETDAHELLLAEGVAAETFIDYTTRDAFENAHEAPDSIVQEMPLPRISSARLVPEHITRRLRPVIAAE